MRALVKAGADPNALEGDRYDIVTIAAVANDLPTLKVALELGCSAKNVTSRYDGTALIAAAHLGHVEVVRELIRAGAPLDHVNNLGWTALIESIVLGDGGPRHTATLEALVDGGREREPCRSRRRDPACARPGRGYRAMVALLEKAGARDRHTLRSRPSVGWRADGCPAPALDGAVAPPRSTSAVAPRSRLRQACGSRGRRSTTPSASGWVQASRLDSRSSASITASAVCGRRARSFSRHAAISASSASGMPSTPLAAALRRRRVHDLVGDLEAVVALEDRLSGEQEVADRAHARRCRSAHRRRPD